MNINFRYYFISIFIIISFNLHTDGQLIEEHVKHHDLDEMSDIREVTTGLLEAGDVTNVTGGTSLNSEGPGTENVTHAPLKTDPLTEATTIDAPEETTTSSETIIIQVETGESVTLPCQTEQLTDVRWEKLDESGTKELVCKKFQAEFGWFAVSCSPKLFDPGRVSMDQTTLEMKINDVQVGDAGLYQCSLSDTMYEIIIMVHCYEPTFTVTDAKIVGSSYIYPNNLTYICDKGKALESNVNGTITSYTNVCTKTGVWSLDRDLHCTADCGEPKFKYSHATRQGESFTEDDLIYYTCDAGFHIVGTENDSAPIETIRCTCDAHWNITKTSIDCVPKNCGRPTNELIHSTMIGNNFSFDALVYFLCDDGHVPGYYSMPSQIGNTANDLIYVGTTWCTSAGVWDTLTEMKCVPKNCGAPTNNLIGASTKDTNYFYPSLVTFTCDPNRKISGTPEITQLVISCTAGGVWNYDGNVSCEDFYCGTPEIELINAEISNPDTYLVSGIIHLQCKPGYIPGDLDNIGLTVTCQESGSWDFQGNITCIENTHVGQSTVISSTTTTTTSDTTTVRTSSVDALCDDCPESCSCERSVDGTECNCPAPVEAQLAAGTIHSAKPVIGLVADPRTNAPSTEVQQASTNIVPGIVAGVILSILAIAVVAFIVVAKKFKKPVSPETITEGHVSVNVENNENNGNGHQSVKELFLTANPSPCQSDENKPS